MDEILIPVKYIELGKYSELLAVICVVFAILQLVTKLSSRRIFEFLFSLTKFIMYAMLAHYMKAYIINYNMKKIGAITTFTYILSCFEAASNLSSIIFDITDFFMGIKEVFIDNRD